MSSTTETMLLIGRKEYLDFPEWDVRRVRAKIDTGARTSALDALSYEVCGDGKVLRMRLALDRRRPERIKIVEAPLVRRTLVCTSSGCRELRPVVVGMIRLGPVTKR